MRFAKGLTMMSGLAGAAALMLVGVAQAEDLLLAPHAGAAPMVGVGVICNTDAQAKQFVALRASGQEIDRAVTAVNTAAEEPRACGVAAVAFVRDETVQTATLGGKLVQIVRINVVAGFDGSGWQRVAGTVQYAIMEGAGEGV
jgi:hypothetical protein